MAILEQALGPDHADVAKGVYWLAELYKDQDDHAKAEPLLERALSILEKSGPEYPYMWLVLVSLATIYQARGATAKARAFFARAKKIEKRHGTPT